MSELCTGKCAECPIIKYAVEGYEKLQGVLQGVAETAMSPLIDTLIAPIILEEIKDLDPEESTPWHERFQSPKDVAAAWRMESAQDLDRLEARLGVIKDQVETIVKDCDGPLSMQAQKAGHIVTAIVCMHPNLSEPGTMFEQVQVTRTATDPA